MTIGCEFQPKTDRLLEAVQQKSRNDKRALRCYRCDPLGQVCHTHPALWVPLKGGDCHPPGADLALPCLASLLELQDLAFTRL